MEPVKFRFGDLTLDISDWKKCKIITHLDESDVIRELDFGQMATFRNALTRAMNSYRNNIIKVQNAKT